MKQALLVIDYTDSSCLKKYERPEWGVTFSAVREMATRLQTLIEYYRTNQCGEIIWIVCCPWVKGEIHPSIERLYETNPDATFYTDGTGASDFYQVSPAPQEKIFQKNMYSAFSGTQGKLNDYLKSQSINHLFISGVYSTGCVNATVCEAFHLGYQLTMIKDCVETFDRPYSQGYQEILFSEWSYMYGEVVESQYINLT